ncbi:protein tyrosine phosphatase [Cohnella kolymensis]|uniref:Tyrosine-protein phosphatase n=1 Tax=Cohnella kolymensis TaxID=1590652 RepID=A0ABR5A2T3_9BACL|nr:CpsB/CapC family capsule biosynthesis tyrosine phosphatase [Cohnella kolymensis]KIL35372.1 protein tyrosine phosphatase [Cohnella kolymensis]
MIDIHTHILPGLDDGADSTQDAVQMARAAWDEGITTIIATPHHANGAYMNPADKVITQVELLNERLLAEGIPIKVLPGQEIRVHNDLLDAWSRRELLTLASTDYMLIELPGHSIPKSITSLIHELAVVGIQPIIAHPERNIEIINNPNILAELIEAGAWTQVTTHSLLGGFGARVQKTAWSLCKKGLIHLVSSDAHHVSRRGFRLKEAYERISTEIGTEWAEYFEMNASRLIDNKSFSSPPKQPNKSKILRKITRFFQK